jgi:5-oxoprolinase (ATP-hydrolysing)
MRVGVDTGGTFTDVVADDGRIAKVPSTPHDPGEAVRTGAAAVSPASGGRPAVLAHGTTVATNALLERKGARVALVTTAGFADVIEIARQDRPSLYDPWADRPEPLVRRELRLEVGGRLGPDGRDLEPLDVATIPAVPDGVDAVAVCLLHSDLDPAQERAVATELEIRGHDVSASVDVSPLFREYERTVTTVANAYLRPVCRSYLAGLADAADDVLVMTSAGGLVPVGRGAEVPVSLLLSGPAGGVLAAAAAADASGWPDAVTFDMGGTSTDVCLVQGGVPEPAGERTVGGFPIRQPSLDVHTIGAGGGSIARIDPGGALAVGPESAGAVPGPASYGLGGTRPTVTDANLVAGRLPAGAELPGIGPLDRAAASAALDGAGVAADDVLTVVDAAMEEAVRAVSVARGVDPAGLALVAFGGAGPLHACAIADALGMPAVVVPARAGVLSAVGCLAAPRQHDVVRSWPGGADLAGLDDALAALAAEAESAVPGAEVTTALDCRYEGQSHELRVAAIDDFAAEHERRNGYARPGTPVEVVALRATARLASPVGVADLPVTERAAAVGPAVIAEPDCTIWVADGWRADPHPTSGALVLTRVARASTTSAASAVSSAGAPGLDAAGLAVLIARLTGVATEMGAVLRRGAFSPNIKERADCSAALFTADGTLLVQAEHIPVHLGSMPASVAAAIEALGEEVRPGEQVVLNDPFAGGTHLNDVTLVAPVFAEGRLVGWVANRAHHADLGGAAPGSMPADATDIQQEGLRIPPVRLTPEVAAIIATSSRTPTERAGDLDAQVGANRLGVERFAALAHEPLHEVVAYGERRMRAALAALPDGTWRFDDVLDSFGPAPGQQQPTAIRLALTVAGDEVTFDLTGTDPQRRGNVNAVRSVTVSSVAWALRSAVDPTIPSNGGALRPVRVIAPAGSVVAAEAPAAVGAGNVEVSQRVADVCLGALAQVLPARVGAASQGTMNNLLLGGDGWVSYETVAGGQGGRPPRPSGGPPVPGMSGVHTAMTNTRNTPTEAFERAFPVRVLRCALRRGSGGAGAAAGGDGIERDLLLLDDTTVSLITERRASHPWGLSGGGPGAVGENWLLPAGDESRAERLPDKCTLHLAAGDVVRMLTPGGGGWGPPEGAEGGSVGAS